MVFLHPPLNVVIVTVVYENKQTRKVTYLPLHLVDQSELWEQILCLPKGKYGRVRFEYKFTTMWCEHQQPNQCTPSLVGTMPLHSAHKLMRKCPTNSTFNQNIIYPFNMCDHVTHSIPASTLKHYIAVRCFCITRCTCKLHRLLLLTSA